MFGNHANETASRISAYDTDSTLTESILSYARKTEQQTLTVIREARALESRINRAWNQAR